MMQAGPTPRPETPTTRRRVRWVLALAALGLVAAACASGDEVSPPDAAALADESADRDGDGADDAAGGEGSGQGGGADGSATGDGTAAGDGDDGDNGDDAGDVADGGDESALQVQQERLGPVGTVIDGVESVVVPNSPGTVTTTGSQRVMTALVGTGPNDFRGGPDQPVAVYFDAVNSELWGEVEGSWLSTDESPLGLYVTHFDFPRPGAWEVVVSAGGTELGRTVIEVVERSTVPGIGDPAPPSVTPVAFTADEMAAITSDHHADLSLYDLTVAEAVGNGRPTVIAFATPAFCRTALCSPTLATVQAATEGRDDLDVVHVEPFDLDLARNEGQLDPIPAMFDWGLVTEPWVFVVDADGFVSASFEGIIGRGELDVAIDAVTAG